MRNFLRHFARGFAATAAMLAMYPGLARAEPIEDWVKVVNKKLDAAAVTPVGDQHGVATVTFRRGDDGRATEINVESGSAAMRRAARRTLERVRGLPTPPAEFASNRIRMQMLIGDSSDPQGYYAQLQGMLAGARASNIQLAQRLSTTRLASNDRP